MKTFQLQIRTIGFLLFLTVFSTGCERELSDDAVMPSFPSTAEVFTDNFIDMGTDFYLPFADAKPDVFSVDEGEGFESQASIRIDVPNATDPSGSYAGAIFRIDGPGRNLTQYHALTFYVKASQGAILGSAGIGLDYEGDKFRTELNNVNVSTNWTKVTIPIPDASKLLRERGVFWFAAGTQGTNGLGYTLWFDEIKFEKMPTIRMVSSRILDGTAVSLKTFAGSSIPITGLTQTYNLENDQDITISSAPAYYDFVSSDTSVATVSQIGVVDIVGTGKADITATLAGVNSSGILRLESLGDLPPSPTPTRPASNVLSIFSDAYDDAVISNFTPGFGGSTSETTILTTSGGEVVQYANNNFTGIMFDENPLNGTAMQFLHIDAYVQNASTSIGIQIRDIGANKTIETNIFTGFPEGDDKDYRTTLSGFQSGVWKSFDIPLGGNIANQKNNLGAIIITDGPNFILDNIYFYKQ